MDGRKDGRGLYVCPGAGPVWSGRGLRIISRSFLIRQWVSREYFQDCGDGGRKTSSVEDEGVDLTKTLFDLAIKAVMLAGEGPV